MHSLFFDCMISQVNERNFPYRKKEQGALEEHHSMQKPNLISNHLELLSDNNYNENMVATRINYLKYNIATSIALESVYGEESNQIH